MWTSELSRILRDRPCVVVTVAAIAGSAPRALGARMLVIADGQRGSIGGGNLEFSACARAREMLRAAEPGARATELYGLGPELNQCCGGAVTLLYERLADGEPAWLARLGAARDRGDRVILATPLDQDRADKLVLATGAKAPDDLPGAVRAALRDSGGAIDPRVVETPEGRWLLEPIGPDRVPLYLFGAGHVGQAVARTLIALPFEITWVDSRPGQFPDLTHAHLRTLTAEAPAATVRDGHPGAVYVVMTHSHALDEDICFEVMRRKDAAWLGVIGSATKRRRFVHRLQKRGIDAATAERLVCPVGSSGITGKRPATIAVALAAQLLQETVPEAWR